jgi:hypothetical protein
VGLVTTVILSPVAPTLIAMTVLEGMREAIELDDFEAAEEIDAGPLPRPALTRAVDPET